MTTQFERTRIASAILTAVALLSSPAFAADTNSTDNTLSVTLGTKDDATTQVMGNAISSAITWNKKWVESYGKKDATTLKLSAGTNVNTLVIGKDGVLTNDLSTVELAGVSLTVNGGSFTNNGTLKLDKDSSMLISKPISFDNSKGSIESLAAITIDDSGLSEAQAQSPKDIDMGNVTLTGTDAGLTNNDKGYTLKTDKNNPKPKARVVFGNVLLKDGATFKQGKDAMDAGDSMSIGKGSSMTIAGQSDWKKLTIDAEDARIQIDEKALLTTDDLSITTVSGEQTLKRFISTTGDQASFKVDESLSIKTFASEDSSFTLKGSDLSGIAISNRAALNLGSTSEYEQNKDGKLQPKSYAVGQVILDDFDAVWTPNQTETKPDKASSGSWSNHAFGDVIVGNNASLTIRNSQFDSASVKEQYKASLELDKLNFQSSAMKLAYKLDTEVVVADINAVIKEQNLKSPEGLNDWTSANLADNMKKWVATLDETAKKKFIDAINAKIDAHADKFGVKDLASTDATHTISGSDVYVRNIRFENKQSEVTGDYAKLTVKAKADEKPEKGKIDLSKTYDDLGTHRLNIIDGSRVEVGSLQMNNGALLVDGKDTKLLIHSVGKIDGEFTAKQGYVGLNVNQSMANYVLDKKQSQVNDSLLLEVNGPVTLGESANVTFGGDAVKNQNDGASITFVGQSTLKFDAASLTKNALFTAKGEKGKLTANNAKVNVEASNLSWGRYNLFENFDAEGVTADNFVAGEGKLTASDKWSEQLKAPGKGIKLEVDEKGNVSVLVGTDSVEGSGLNVNAKNLVSAIFKGDRASGDDISLINSLLHSGSTLDEVSNTINAVTGLGVISSVKALTVDFAGYTADQIEHHASTMPHNMGGWWIQPMGTRMKTDDLAMGGTAYGYSLDAYGLMGGYDIHAGDWTFGLAGSYQDGDADSEGDVLPATTKIKNKAAHVWGAKTYGQTYVIGTLSYIKSEGETSMGVLDKTLSSEIEATAWSAGVRAERAFPMGGFTFTPHIGARATMIDMSDYTIDMDDKKLFDIHEDKATIFEVPVGLAMKTPTFMFQTFTVQPYADLTIRGRFGDTESSYTLTGSKTVDCINYDVAGEFVGDLKLGYVSTYKDLNLGMSYSLSAGDAGRQNHAIEATMRVDF